MKKVSKILITGCFCLSLVHSFPAFAALNLETESSVAGIAVVLNNYYASTENPEVVLADKLSSEQTFVQLSQSVKEEVPQVKETPLKTAASAYENVAISQVTDYVNIRQQPNTASEIVGKIYNNCAATILTSVSGEGGQWYQIQSGSVSGYIKAQYFITGSAAEAKAKEVGVQYATVSGTGSLRLREKPDLESKTLTLLAEGAHYLVTEESGDFLKLSIDNDLEGYVFKEFVKTNVEFKQAVSVAEEKAKTDDEAARKKEAEDAIKKLDTLKQEAKVGEKPKESKAAAKQSTTAAPKKTAAENSTIAANPEKDKSTAAAPPKQTTAAPVAAPTKENSKAGPASGSGPDSSSGSSAEVATATRTAVVAYAKQFQGNPYVYGGTSLTNGADCSGFTSSIFAHFGISIGRSSRDQAAKGREVSQDNMQPGDLLFYASGDYINHVALYIGGGQIIHASNPTTGITISPYNYRTPCKVVSFLD